MDVDNQVPPPTEDERHQLLEDAQHNVSGAREALQHGGAPLQEWRRAKENLSAK